MDNPHATKTSVRDDPADRLRREYRDHELPQLLSDLEQQWRQALETGCRLDALKELACLTHALASGSSGFGFTETATLAQRIDHSLRAVVQDRRSPTLAEKQAISATVAELGTGVAPTSGAPLETFPTHPATAGNKPLVYLVDSDAAQGHYLAIQLSAHGFEVRCFEGLDPLREALLTHPPTALVVDTLFPEGDTVGIEAVAALRRGVPTPPPVAFISARHDAPARLAALRAGGIGYYTKPVPVPALATRLRETMELERPLPLRVLMVDDDQAVLELYAHQLRAAGFQVQALTDPLALMDVALDFHPELILLDLYMPGVDGLEVSRLLRQEESLLDVPIVFLSGEKDPDRHLQAVDVGALDFLVKPVQPARLVELARSRAAQYRRRAARIRYLGRTDPITGLYDRHYFANLLSERQAKPGDGTDAVLFLELNGYAELCRQHPPELCKLLRVKLAEAIRSHLSGDDVAASYSDSAFTVLARRQVPAALENLTGELARAMAATRVEMGGHDLAVTTSIGVAVLGESHQSALGKAAMLAAEAQWRQNHAETMAPTPLDPPDPLDPPPPPPPDTTVDTADRQQHWLKEISGAVKENRLFLVFQPITSLGADTVERYEALLRLKSSDGHVILPGQFMDIAAKLKLTRVLDRWVVRNALALLGKRQKDAYGTVFFIKLSNASIQDDEFPGWLEGLLDKYPVAAHSAVFEFNGADLLADEHASETLLRRLRALQFHGAVEHVGTDERALRLLDVFTLDYLKLDRSLTHKLQEDQAKQARIMQLIEKAQAKSVKTLAAYVEDASCLALLWQHRIDLIQGNLLQQPDENLRFAMDV